MRQPIFALIDCNNFFASCERAFRPDLQGKPVVVLSSNDGCVVARSNEVKALGIPMAAPAFKYRDIFTAHNVVQFSANFELYGDISRRITDILTTVTPRIEIYSVDESFLDLSELHITNYAEWGRMVRDKVWQWVGVPVSIGIASSKTLAKLAADRAKKDDELAGVLSFIEASPKEKIAYLQTTPINDIWGVGWRLTPRLRAEGLFTAYDIACMRPQRAQQLMGIHGRQMVAELGGLSCYPLELEGKIRKSIARTRTFGHDTSDLNSIEAAVTTFVTKAAFRLRVSGQVTKRAGLFLATNKHKPGYRMWSQEIHLSVPTADTGKLISYLLKELRRLYSPSHKYYRAGVWLDDFLPAHGIQADLFGHVNVAQETAAAERMEAIDHINEKFGRDTIRYAAEDLGQQWRPRYNLRSPRYTTRLDELPELRLN
jgi:DNA polymerase V